MNTTHTVTATVDTAYAETFPNAAARYVRNVKCSDPVHCGGWIDCPEGPHELDPDDIDDEETTIHGRVHAWFNGEWRIPVRACLVVMLCNPWDIDIPDRPGTWTLDVEWRDGDGPCPYVVDEVTEGAPKC